MKVSFVCTGNICRSVIGIYIFKKFLQDNGITDISVDGYGMKRNAGGEKPPKFILEALKEYGIDASNHISKKISPEILQSHIVICFVNSHIQKLQEYGCKNVFNIKELASYIPDSCSGGVSVPDPYFDKSVTQDICTLVQFSCKSILRECMLEFFRRRTSGCEN